MTRVIRIEAKLFQPDPQHLASLVKGVDIWNDARNAEDFRPNLMGADIYGAFQNSNELKNGKVPLRGVDLHDAVLVKAILRDSNLESANLRNAQLSHADLQYADLSSAQLQLSNLENTLMMGANLLRARLCGANLQGARLDDAHLVDADVSGANLRDGDFYATELFRANLARTQLWKAKLYPAPDTNRERVESLRAKLDRVSSVSRLAQLGKLLRRHYPAEDYTVYFRGDSKECELQPTVHRRKDDMRRYEEGEMIRDLMSRRPEEFVGTSSALDKWVLARHYGLKTRLLDITRNPLVALFHACFSPEDNVAKAKPDGRVHIFAVPNGLIRPFDSDTISVIANFARLSVAEQNMLLGKKIEDVSAEDELSTPDKHQAVNLRLHQFIKQEKPYFEERIDPRDLYRVFVVEPRQAFERVRAQSGAFLISAFHERFEQDEVHKWNEDIPIYDYYQLKVPRNAKSRVLDELSLFNITQETLYPSLDTAASAVNALWASPAD